jgi:hypothetical protein|tara:strand:+ start:20 stop:352 length:333 start_codon:yes stop_codon:yes gene_type:complete
MVRFFYFGENTVETTGEACMFPLSSFLGIKKTGSAESTLFFKSRNGEATSDLVVITHTGYTHNKFTEEFVHFMQVNQRNPFLTVTSGDLTTGTANFVTWKITSTAVTTQS